MKTCKLCKEKHFALGYCRTHYDKHRTYGDAAIVKTKKGMGKVYKYGRRKCTVEEKRMQKVEKYAKKQDIHATTLLDRIIDFFFKHNE